MIIHIGVLSELPMTARTVVMLGRRGSDHLRELVRIAEFKGRAAYRIERASELQPRWFTGVHEVGVVVGATGLEAVLGEVRDRLQRFEEIEAQGMLEGVAR